MKNQQLLNLKIAGFFACIFSLNAATATADLTMSKEDVEVTQAEASIYFHRDNLKESVEALRTIVKGTPNGSASQVEALELIALNYRKNKEDTQAAGVYKKLIATAPKNKIAPYHFELGTIRFQQKKPDEARMHFEYTSKADFNAGTSRFFLGLIDLEDHFERSALYHFSTALKYEDAEPILPAIRYYLATTYVQLGKIDYAIRNYKQAIKEAAEVKNKNSIVENASNGAHKVIEEMDESTWFKSATLLAQYDSNVQSNPDATAAAVGPAGQSSIKSVISANIGYASSPTRTWQFIPAYSFYGNYNFNKLTRDFNFASNTGSLTIYHQPWKRFSKGFRAQSIFSFKNSPTTVGGTFYKKYSLTHEFGPTFKYEVNPRTSLGIDLLYKPKTFYTDPSTGPNKRSGYGYGARFSLDYISTSEYWSPQGYFSFDRDQTQGTTFDSTSLTLGLGNSMQINQKLTLRPSVDFTLSSYPYNRPSRSDKLLNLRVVANHTVNKDWSLTGDVGFTSNASSVPSSYKYKRTTVSAGATYNF